MRWPWLEQTRELFSERRFRHAVASAALGVRVVDVYHLVAVVYRLPVFRCNASRIEGTPPCLARHEVVRLPSSTYCSTYTVVQ